MAQERDLGAGTGPRGRKRLVLLVVCLCLAALVAGVLISVFAVGPKARDQVGALAGGKYYFSNSLALYAYTPEPAQKQLVMFKKGLKHWVVDESGLYYIEGSDRDRLYLREHQTGQTKLLYQSEAGPLEIVSARGGAVTVSDGDSAAYTLLQIEGESGEILNSEEGTAEAPVYPRFYAGETGYDLVFADGRRQLTRDGRSVLPEGATLSEDPFYIGDDLLIAYDLDPGKGYLLARPDGELRPILEEGNIFLTGADGYVIYQEDEGENSGEIYCYDIQKDEHRQLHSGMDLNWATTDGTHLYTYAPWSGGRTDCWTLAYDEAGDLTGLDLLAQDI